MKRTLLILALVFGFSVVRVTFGLDELPPFAGGFRPPLQSEFINPPLLDPDTEVCGDGEDGDGDGLVDWADPDCQMDLPRQVINLRTPLNVLEAVPGFAPFRVAPGGLLSGIETNRAGLPFGSILINTTGAGGRKLGYLRTTGRNIYGVTSAEIVLLPGVAWSGVLAIRIQAADAATNPGASYYAKVGIGNAISINRQNSDGTSTELASTSTWDNGDAVDIEEYDADLADTMGNACYRVRLSAVEEELGLTVRKVDCAETYFLNETPSFTATLAATDGTLTEGYVGLRSDNDGGDEIPDDEASSALVDPSILHFAANENQVFSTSAPRIGFFGSSSGDLRSRFDYTADPVFQPTQSWMFRTGTPVSDTSVRNYLSSLGFRVADLSGDVFELGEQLGGVYTTEDYNNQYDMGMGTSSASPGRDIHQEFTIPYVTFEHPDTRDTGLAMNLNPDGSSGDDRRVNCTEEQGGGVQQGYTQMQVINAGVGNPDHPIIEGLADADGNIDFYHASGFDQNVPWAFPGDVLSISGNRFEGAVEMFTRREMGLGSGSSSYAGWPLAPAATPLATAVHPCTGEGFFKLDENGDLDPSLGGKGHVSILAVEAGEPRIGPTSAKAIGTPENPGQYFCQDPCVFPARQSYFPLSDRNFGYVSADARRIFRREVLWVLGYIGQPGEVAVGGRDNSFNRGDANSDGTLDLSDGLFTLNFLFSAGPVPTCVNAADLNDDNEVDLSDGVFTFNFLFNGGPTPAAPFGTCGLDFTPAPGRGMPPSCDSFENCPNN